MAEPESADAAFERGHAAGEIAARLAAHDQHFADINGSIQRMVERQQETNLILQRQGDAAAADRAAAEIVAKALKAAEEARDKKSSRTWTPMARLLAVLGGIAALATAAGIIWSLARP
jgi:hypothetical protein